METNKIIVGNMKMNLTFDEISNYIYKLEKHKNFIICPSSIYIPFFLKEGFTVGIQNVSEYGVGAYTGEISVNQATSMGVKYTLVGHSERRTYFKEDDDIINLKLRKSVSNNLISILCIGETSEEKEAGKTLETIKKQLKKDLHDIASEYYENIIIAYEPVWAIGTGKVPTNEEIDANVTFIKETVKNDFDFEPKILYGGSINEKNIEELNKIKSIDGFLVGGACLIPDKIIKIIETIS